MYSIEFSQLAERQLGKLENDIQNRIIKVLERIKVRPHPFVKRLVGLPYYSLRVGDYKVILTIREQIIFIVELGHRKNIYE